MSFYAVKEGRIPGIYYNWEECKEQIHKYPAAKYKKFASYIEACQYVGMEPEIEIGSASTILNQKDSLKSDDDRVLIFTDGASKFNPGKGGTGTLVIFPDGRRIQCGMHIPQTTNNIAELEAIHHGLVLTRLHLQDEKSVEVHTDSKYSIGVLTRKTQAHVNKELIEKICGVIDTFTVPIQWNWVKGHSGNIGNERVDALAQACCTAENFL